MKKLIITFLCFFATSLYAEIDEYKSDVYFANGINTTKKQAIKVKNELLKKTKKTNPETYESVSAWEVSYNNTDGMFFDLYESMLQKIYADGYGVNIKALLWNWEEVVDTIDVFGLYTKGVKNIFKQVKKRLPQEQIKEYSKSISKQMARKAFKAYNDLGNVKLSEEQIELIFTTLFDEIINNAIVRLDSLAEAEIVKAENRDVGKQVNRYYESAKDGHGIIVIAHSQGNLFTNRAYFEFSRPFQFPDVAWVQNYFHVFGVATPANNVIGENSPYITFHNDIIRAVPDSLPSNLTKAKTYYYTNIEGQKIENDTSMEAHSFLSSYMSHNISRHNILGYIKDSVEKHKIAPSQWKVESENDTTSLCEERRAKLVHFKNAVEPIDSVYPFNTTNGKVYPVGGEYVLASLGGEKRVDLDPDVDDRCYELEGTAKPDVISIENTCSEQTVTIGAITVDLAWQNKKLDLDLTISGPPVGNYENKDTGCPTEHFYVLESAVTAGTYKVMISSKGTVDYSMIPEDVYIVIQAKGKTETLQIPVESVEAFNMGYVAEIKVTENKVMTTTVSSTTSSGTSIRTYSGGISGGGGGGGGTSTPIYTKYIYQIIPLLNQLVYGPVRGSHLQFYSVSDYAAGLSPLFTGSTSTGSDLHTAGIIIIPFTLVDQLNDNELYLLNAEGGEDIDSNDDGVLDDFPTQNYGVLHGVMSGTTIKDGAYKLNVLTELVYQVTKDMFDVNSSEKILERINKVAPRLISKDVNGDGEINSIDLVKWLPTLDKEKLAFDYNTTFEPIVKKLFNGEDVFADAYKLLYYPIADAGEDMFIGVAPPLTLDGSKSYDINGNIVEYFWLEGETPLCKSDAAVCEIDMLSVGQHSITLRVTDNDGEVQEDNITVVINTYAPTADAGIDQEIFKDSTITLDGSNSYDSNGNIVEYLWMVGETVFCQSSNPICVIESLSVSKDYTFVLKVTDNEGFSGQDNVNVTYPYKPVAVAGDDVSINFGESITLDGSSSYDSDGYIVEYQWSEGDILHCSGTTPACTVDGLASGTHLFELQVRDEKGAIGRDSIELKVEVSANKEAFIIGSLDTPGLARRVVLSTDGVIAYVTDGVSGLQIIDISNPTSPSLIGNYNTSNDLFAIAISKSGTIAYVTDDMNSLQIIDISNPTSPSLIGSYKTPSYTWGVTLSTDGTIAYVSGDDGLQIIDISNPTSPSLIGSYKTSKSAWDVAISTDGTIAYMSGDDGLQIIDISNPTTPSLIGSYNTYSQVWAVTLSTDGTIAYVVGPRDLQIIDISNPTTPSLIGSYNVTGYIWNVTLSIDGTIVYLTTDYGLQIIDVSNPIAPSVVGKYNTIGHSFDVALSADGTTAYVADLYWGLQIIDVSDFAY